MTDSARNAQEMVARHDLVAWLLEERAGYADKKYANGTVTRDEFVEDLRNGYGLDARWLDFPLNYVQRAKLVGLDTPQGRQAMGKAIATLMHYLETAIVEFGPMPQPGISSSEGVREWVRDA